MWGGVEMFGELIKFMNYLKDEEGLRKILKMGADKARASASETIKGARKLIGINY